jgi:hypothetical protein
MFSNFIRSMSIQVYLIDWVGRCDVSVLFMWNDTFNLHSSSARKNAEYLYESQSTGPPPPFPGD